MQPDIPPHVPKHVTGEISPQKHYLAAFFLSFMWGIFGADRFYLGYYGLGFIKLISFGGFGILALYDFTTIASGRMKDSHGRDLLQLQEYRPLTNRVLTIFTTVLVIGLLLTGIATWFALSQILPLLQGGDIQNMIQELIMGQAGGLTPDQTQQLQDLQSSGYESSLN